MKNLFIIALSVCASSAQPVLELQKEGPRVSVESSDNLRDWVSVTNVDFSRPTQFFRAKATSSLPFNFKYEPCDLARIDFTNEVFYFPRPDGLPDAWPYHNADGIRMYKHTDGVIYDHPVLQAQYGLIMFNGYFV